MGWGGSLEHLLSLRKRSLSTRDLSLLSFAQKWVAEKLRATLATWRGGCRCPPKSVSPGS